MIRKRSIAVVSGFTGLTLLAGSWMGASAFAATGEGQQKGTCSGIAVTDKDGKKVEVTPATKREKTDQGAKNQSTIQCDNVVITDRDGKKVDTVPATEKKEGANQDAGRLPTIPCGDSGSSAKDGQQVKCEPAQPANPV
ncbi:hypothetical protein GCM10012275_44370 [Longimycelium tulufanense]|uniref:Secreted protein n=2 Tax=Longimycelium tulufanense TaxID=907463 RepID=A0A8J3FW50_9PSEU|nr:hypothetical protein GCM10012275_44370 [Longimycelium tulufanense]